MSFVFVVMLALVGFLLSYIPAFLLRWVWGDGWSLAWFLAFWVFALAVFVYGSMAP